MTKQLVLENERGEVARVFAWSGTPAKLIRRKESRRVELWSDFAALERSQINYDFLGHIELSSLEKAPFQVESGRLVLVSKVDHISPEVPASDKESSRPLYLSLAAGILLMAVAVSVLGPEVKKEAPPKVEEQVVQIVQKIKPKPVAANANTKLQLSASEAKPQQKTMPQNVGRMGALAMLGSLNKSANKGGINIGAAQASAGPGLGGLQGSGGIQTSMYGKGIVGAPVGPGANAEGAGGYGTKGRGGGQAGYGSRSLVGSGGGGPIALGREAIIEGGLDRDLINDVINRNIGQIRFCYEQGLQSDPKLEGRVAVDFVIGGNGLVSVASVANTSLQSKVVEDCILMRLKSWKFPFPQGGVDVKVSYPFVLKKVGRG